MPSLGAYGALMFSKNRLEMRKLCSPKVEGIKNWKKKQTSEHYNAHDFLTPQNFFVCCFVAIRVQR
jgi:hypothetical protein